MTHLLLNGYHQIKGITADKIKDMSFNSVNKFRKFINEVNPAFRVIIIRHFPPLPDGTSHPKYSHSGSQSRNLNNYFSWRDLAYGISNVEYWCSGPTHHCYQIEINGIKYISNQIGYMIDDQNPSSDVIKV